MAKFKLTKSAAKELQALVDAYEIARSDLAQALEDLASEWEGEYEEMSDKWKEGDAGQEAEERVTTARGWCDEFPDAFEGDIDSLT